MFSPLYSSNPAIKRINLGSLLSKSVHVVNTAIHGLDAAELGIDIEHVSGHGTR